MISVDEQIIERLPTCVVFRSRSSFERRLCNLLADTSSAVMALSFAEPVRDTIRGIFYSGDPSVDFDAPEFALPIKVELTYVEEQVEKFLRQLFGEAALGRLAVLNVQSSQPMWEVFAFEDGHNEADVAELREKFGTAKVLEVWVGHTKDLVELPSPTEAPRNLYVPILSPEKDVDNNALIERFILCYREWADRNGVAVL